MKISKKLLLYFCLLLPVTILLFLIMAFGGQGDFGEFGVFSLPIITIIAFIINIGIIIYFFIKKNIKLGILVCIIAFVYLAFNIFIFYIGWAIGDWKVL